MDKEEIEALAKMCGVDGSREEEVCLAAGLYGAGFSYEEIRRYMHTKDRDLRLCLLNQKREEIVKEIHRANECLGKVDYLRWVERGGEA